MSRLVARVLVLTIGVLPAVPACAGKPVLSPAVVVAKSPPLARTPITGVIVNGVTSRPLVGAILELDGHPFAESDIQGRFRIDDVSVGMHLLTSRAQRFRSRVQPVNIVVPDSSPDAGPRNDFIVLLFAPSAYFDGFPVLGNAPFCRTNADCPSGQICLMNNFKEMDAPACAVPKICATESDCKLGQQCEPVTLGPGKELRVCQGQPAPEVSP